MAAINSINYLNPASSARPFGDQSPFGPSWYTPPPPVIAPATRAPAQNPVKLLPASQPPGATSASSPNTFDFSNPPTGPVLHTNDASGGGNDPNAPPPEPPQYQPPGPPSSGPPQTTTPPATGGHQENALTQWARPQLQAAYKKYLGRDISDDEFWNYLGPSASSTSVQQAIDNVRTSPESQAYQAAHPTTWGQNPATSTTPSGGNIFGNWNGTTLASGLAKAFQSGLRGEAAVQYANQQDGGGYAFYPDKNVYAVPGGRGYILQNGQGTFDYAPGDAGGGGGSNYGGTNVFNDPATQHFEELLNQRIQELLGPAYTNSQMDLMQTQALDPLEQQRSAAKQQVIQRMAAHGVPPSSGIVEKALEDVDRQFNTLRTTSQAGFANKAIDQTAQNRNQAVNLAEVIPQLAWGRLQGATTNPLNSSALLSLLNGFQQNGFQNSNQFMQSLIPILMQLFQ